MQSWNKILHGSVLTGADPEGMLSAVRSMAQTLLCSEGHRGEAFGKCSCCRKIYKDIHPDVSFIRRGFQKDGKTLRSEIVVDQIRAVAKDSVVLPNEARAKIYVFPEADTLNASAQNALLKLLEEPPTKTNFILVTEQPDMLLSTILSRVQQVSIPRLSEQELTAYGVTPWSAHLRRNSAISAAVASSGRWKSLMQR